MKLLVTKILMLVLILPLSLLSVGANAEDTQWVAGKHYKVLPYPVRTRDAAKIEVVELFWYGCPHCYTFNPLVHHWAGMQADDVDFWLSPATFGKVWTIHAQAFYTAQALGIQDKMHQPLFDAIARDRKLLNSEDALAKFFAGYGVSEADFKKTFKSFSVKSKVDQAAARGRSYRATGVPAIIVNGKFRVSASEAGSQEKMLEVVDFLVKRERTSAAQ